jgi:hypothetical protein
MFQLLGAGGLTSADRDEKEAQPRLAHLGQVGNDHCLLE